MSWEPELEELRRREALAHKMGGEERVERQRAAGKLTVRERIERRLDAGTFHETGVLAGVAAYGDDGELEAFLPANRAQGLRRRGRRPRRPSRLNTRYAWPSGDWGSLPIAGGLEAAYRRELEAAEDPVARRAEIEERLNAVRSPSRTAERFGVEEIVDPRDTRPLLCAWAERAHELVTHELGGGPKSRGPRP